MKMKPIKSSNLVSGGYDAKTKKVRVEFANGTYQSEKEITEKDWKAFESTFQTKDSSGKYFHSNMKQFGFKKV